MKKLLILTFLVVVVLALVISGCAKTASPAATTQETLQHTYGLSKGDSPAVPVPAAPPIVITIPRPAPAPTPSPAPVINIPQTPPMAMVTTAGEEDASQTWAGERMIVRTGNITLVVEDVPSAIDRINKLADSFGGYVVSSNVWEEGMLSSEMIITPGYKGEVPEVQSWKRFAGSISIRVPSERYEDAMRALRGMAVQVTSENSTSKDVTEEYVDLKAKLQNLEATEAQLFKLMQKAEKVEDILNVQRELFRVRGDIEQTKGRMQYLERTSSTSLINVQLQQAKLDISFTANKSRAKKGETIMFIPRIAGGIAPYSYEWNFGDGHTSTDRTPEHAYNKAGDYNVSLKVTDDRSSTDTEKRTDYITVLPGWNAGNIASGAWNGFVVFCQVVADILIWLGIFSPLWIVGGGIAYWIIRRKRARH
jgi:PKD repeat protein